MLSLYTRWATRQLNHLTGKMASADLSVCNFIVTALGNENEITGLKGGVWTTLRLGQPPNGEIMENDFPFVSSKSKLFFYESKRSQITTHPSQMSPAFNPVETSRHLQSQLSLTSAWLRQKIAPSRSLQRNRVMAHFGWWNHSHGMAGILKDTEITNGRFLMRNTPHFEFFAQRRKIRRSC